jgi:2-oxoglutarate ferredoxin oxidoreductase subunit delta
MSYIVIDEDRCKGCELCTTVCPQGDLVQMANHFNAKGYLPSAFVDPLGKCTGCTLCAMMCPDVVITVYRTVRKQRQG